MSQKSAGWWVQQRSISWIARRLRLSQEWVYKWIWRYREAGPTWFQEGSRRPHQMVRRVDATFEEAVIRTHARLTSPRNPLGFYGAEAIAQELADLRVRPLHSIRTIHRILVRHKLVTRTRRHRSRRGPSLSTPSVRRQNDVHQLDFIVGHYLGARRPVVILTRKDMATGLVGGTEQPDRRVQRVLAFLTRDWHSHGRPRVVQMDNDMSLTGGRFHPRSLGQLIRFCLACRVIPVFMPDRQPAANAQVERYNGLWQEKVWQRYRFRTLRHLRARSHAFQMAYNTYLTRRLIHQGQHARHNGPRRTLPVPPCAPPAATLSRTDLGDQENR